MHATVKNVVDDLHLFTSPIIAQFENGSLNYSPDIAKRIKLELYTERKHEPEEHRKHTTKLLASSGNMKYIGSHLKQPSRYYLGVLQNETGNLDLYRSDVFKLTPSVIGDNNRTLDNGSASTTETFVEKTDRLIEAFGSARQKRAVSARKRNLVDKEALTSKISEVADNVDLSENILDISSSSTDPLIPEINTNASTPAQLYDVRNIISLNDENVLSKHVNDFVQVNSDIMKEWRVEKKYSEYILNQLSCLPISAEARLEKALKLLYLSYLMQLFKLTHADLRKKDSLSNIPAEIKNKLLNEFTLEKDKKRLIPKRFKDKTLCYILILALIIDEFVLDCSLLMRDLKLGPARIHMHLKAIGCVVTSKKSKKTQQEHKQDQEHYTSNTTATLKIPLPKSFLQKKESKP